MFSEPYDPTIFLYIAHNLKVPYFPSDVFTRPHRPPFFFLPPFPSSDPISSTPLACRTCRLQGPQPTSPFPAFVTPLPAQLQKFCHLLGPDRGYCVLSIDIMCLVSSCLGQAGWPQLPKTGLVMVNTRQSHEANQNLPSFSLSMPLSALISSRPLVSTGTPARLALCEDKRKV